MTRVPSPSRWTSSLVQPPSPSQSSVFRRALVGVLTLSLASTALSATSSGGAVMTDRDTIADNRYATDQSLLEPYGVHEATIKPYVGDAFVDNSRGSLDFQLFAGSVPPGVTPPSIPTGGTFEITIALPASLEIRHSNGTCAPVSGNARTYVSTTCETTDHPAGSSTAVVTFTAQREVSGSAVWGFLKSHTVQLFARDGQIGGTDRANVMIDFHDDAYRRSTREVPFVTAVGSAHDLNVDSARATNDSRPGNISPPVQFFQGETGYISFETKLADSANRGIDITTGESFTYALRIPQNTGGGRGGIVYNPDPPAENTTVNACTRVVEGYDTRCEVTGDTVRLITTRTGPDVVDDHPLDDRLYIPVITAYTHPVLRPIYVDAHVTLTSAMAQSGSDRPRLGVAELAEWGQPRTALGVHNLSMDPYVGDTFAEYGTGRLRFDFYAGTDRPSAPLVRSGDVLTVTATLGSSFTPSTAPSGAAQGDGSRNWCDGLDAWGSGFEDHLGTPSCATSTDPGTGAVTVTITVQALQDVPNDAFAEGFQLRVDSAGELAEDVQPVTVELASTRPGSVRELYRQGTVDVPTMSTDAMHASSLGIWGAQFHPGGTNDGAPEPAQGRLEWSPDPSEMLNWPLAIETGDVITYSVDLPEGVSYSSSPAPGAVDVCAFPDRYIDFVASCVVSPESVDFTLTRTGPDNGAFFIDPALPFTLPLAVTGEDVGDIVVTLDTTVKQSGSDQRRAVVPVATSLPGLPKLGP